MFGQPKDDFFTLKIQAEFYFKIYGQVPKITPEAWKK